MRQTEIENEFKKIWEAINFLRANNEIVPEKEEIFHKLKEDKIIKEIGNNMKKKEFEKIEKDSEKIIDSMKYLTKIKHPKSIVKIENDE